MSGGDSALELIWCQRMTGCDLHVAEPSSPVPSYLTLSEGHGLLAKELDLELESEV